MRMQKIIFYCFLFTLISCGGNSPAGKQQADADTSTAGKSGSTTPIPVTTNKEAGEHALWMGLFAQWKKSVGEIIDGKYDTSNHIFFACQAANGFPVDAGQVALLPTSTCDQTSGTEVAVLERMVVKPGETAGFVKIPSVITLTDSNRMHPKASLILNNKETPITLDQESIKRLNNSKKVLNNVHFKNN
jgi:hypothetical protein